MRTVRSFLDQSSLADEKTADRDVSGGAPDPRLYEFQRLFLKTVEHTWGVDVKKCLNGTCALSIS